MATTSVAAIGDDGTITGALAKYLRSVAEPNLFRSYEFMPLATEAVVPAGQGLYMQIPSFANNSTSGVAGATFADRANSLSPITSAEVNPLLGTSVDLTNFRSTSVSNVDRKQSYFTDGFAVSKLYKDTATVQGEFERIAQFIMKTAAATQEILVQNNIIFESGAAVENTAGGYGDPTGAGVVWNGLSAEGATASEPLYVSPDVAATAWGSIAAGDFVVANKFAMARKLLKERGNPGFTKLGGRLAALIGPDTLYRLTTSVAATSGIAALTFEQESMNYTDTYRSANIAGDLFGFRLIETNNPITIASGTTNGPSGTVDCEINVLFAPDAFYVTPHARLTPQLYVSGFGEGGPLNPTKTIASLATDFLFGARRGPDFENKMVLMPCSLT
jgi:hypothetical protein